MLIYKNKVGGAPIDFMNRWYIEQTCSYYYKYTFNI